jgi:hypothetical protein
MEYLNQLGAVKSCNKNVTADNEVGGYVPEQNPGPRDAEHNGVSSFTSNGAAGVSSVATKQQNPR